MVVSAILIFVLVCFVGLVFVGIRNIEKDDHWYHS